MDIRKSALITIFLGCVFTTQAYASNKLKADPFINQGYFSCTYLVVQVAKTILDDYIMSVDQIVTNHGNLLGCKPVAWGPARGALDCQFEQSASYGPDASLTFVRKTDGQLATIRVQQNYCFMEAGNITVEPILGKWKYRTIEGSYGSFMPGFVWLDQLSLDN